LDISRCYIHIKTFKTLTRAAAAASFLAVQAIICIGTVYWAIAETLRMEGTPALMLGVVLAIPSAYLLVVSLAWLTRRRRTWRTSRRNGKA